MASLHKRKLKKGIVYYAIYRINGRQKWKSLGCNYSVAKIKLKEIEYKLALGDIGGLKKDKAIPFSQFANERYLPWMETRRAKKTYLSAKNSCVRLLRFFKDAPLTCIDSKMIEDYIKTRKDKVKPRTVNIELTCLGQIFRKAIEEKYYSKENPVRRIEKLKVPQRHPRFLSKEEMQNIWKVSSPWVKVFIAVSAHSGMRAGEISSLCWDDIDWARNVIRVRTTKTNIEREIPMDDFLKIMLLWFQANYVNFRVKTVTSRASIQMRYVFCDSNGDKIESFRHGFNKAKREAGINDITIHTLRHTFASHLANKGVPLFTIGELLGHTNTRTTKIYSHLANEHLQKAVNQIDYGINVNNFALLENRKPDLSVSKLLASSK